MERVLLGESNAGGKGNGGGRVMLVGKSNVGRKVTLVQINVGVESKAGGWSHSGRRVNWWGRVILVGGRIMQVDRVILGGKSHWREENEGAGSSSVSFYEGGNLSPKDLPSCIIG